MCNRIQPYAWGSRTLLADLQHREPPDEPEAELWMGGHPGGPSLIYLDEHSDPIPINVVFQSQPERFLGPTARVVDPDEPLPFLLKVLAIAEPLSIQVHPNSSQALAGFDREEAAGIPRDDPARSYCDRNSKPEYTVALSPVLMLNGQRPAAEISEIATYLDLPWLHGLPAAEPIKKVLTFPEESVLAAIAETSSAITRVTESGVREDELSEPVASALTTWHQTAAKYPGDRGLLVALCMNLVRIDAGLGIATPAGQLHAYLSGLAVELQAPSDNVLRAGLTPKHIDVPELLRVMNPNQVYPVVEEPQKLSDGTEQFTLWDPGISLRRARVAGQLTVSIAGPAILLATDGDHSVEVDGRFLPLRRGYSLLMTGTAVATIRGTGEVYIAAKA